MFFPRCMVSLSMVLGSGPVRLCCVLVKFCGLVMSVFRHNCSFHGTMHCSTWMSGIEVKNTTLLSFNRHPITLMVGSVQVSSDRHLGMQVSASGATNDPQFVSVILTVLPAGSNLGPIIQPAGIIFTAVAGAQPPGSQTVTVQSTSSAPVDFTSGPVTADGTNRFQSLPQSGTVTRYSPSAS
jgi:hypothetical protein